MITNPIESNKKYAQLGLIKRNPKTRFLSQVRKPYFRECDLFSKAVEMNLSNNCRLRNSPALPAYFWRENRTDILHEYNLEEQLTTLRENIEKSFDQSNTLQSKNIETPIKTEVNRSGYKTQNQTPALKTIDKTVYGIGLNTFRQKSENNKHIDYSPDLKRSVNLPEISKLQSIIDKRNSTKMTDYAKLIKERRTISTARRYKSTERPSKSKFKQIDISRKDYSISTETVNTMIQPESNKNTLENNFETIRIKPHRNTESTIYNLINGANNSERPEEVRQILLKDPIAARRKSSNVTKEDGNHWSKEFSNAISKEPSVFHRNGELCWHEAVNKKSYGPMIRGVYKPKV